MPYLHGQLRQVNEGPSTPRKPAGANDGMNIVHVFQARGTYGDLGGCGAWKRRVAAILDSVTFDRLGWESNTADVVELYQRIGRFGIGSPLAPRDGASFVKVVGFWVPRRWVTPDAMDIKGLVGEIEETVRSRGFIGYDGQVLTRLTRVGIWEASFEAVSIDEPLDVPPRRSWGPEQRAFFGREQPYQMADDPAPFTWSNVSVSIASRT